MSQPQIAQIQTMMDLQDRMNTRVHPQWRAQRFAWYRAAWVECAELLDHYGWKWWKHQQTDREQMVLELIDIWHFGLSNLLERGLEAGEICRELTLGLDEGGSNGFAEQLESFTLKLLQTRGFDPRGFGSLMRLADLDFERLYRSYVGKNVLNLFRQDRGYQQGTYVRVWQGRDDNEWLVEHMNRLEASAEDFASQLYRALEASYPAARP